MISLDQDRDEATALAFDPNILKDKVALNVGKSLGVSEEFLNSEQGTKMLSDISEFLVQERNVDRVETVKSALVELLNSLTVPMNLRYPEGLAQRLHAHLMGKKHRGKIEAEIAENERLWLPKP